ncbi:MAG: diguanylate cyclase [Clostridiales Family XIII bacterium]|jgi:diguanylate cyclase (GGDEF)-like protein|nr:diguanylate cyclase [Clostridiales Family XIII bacterium]
MTDTVLIAIAIVAIAVAVFVSALTLFKAESKKKNWFMLMMMAIIVFLIGHLLELISSDVGGAFTASRVLYIGSQLVGPFALFFVADFCEIKIHRWLVRVPLLALGVFCIVVMWTTDKTHWLYKEYWLSTENGHLLDFVPAPGYSIMHIVPAALLVVCMVFILYRIKTWGREQRKGLVFIAAIVLIPFVSEVAYYLLRITGNLLYHIYLTPHSLLLMSALLFYGIIRYDIVEVKGVARARAIDLMSDAYILVDAQHKYVTSNNSAKVMFPPLRALLVGEPIDEMPGWPEILKGEVCEGEGCSIEYEAPGENASGLRYFIAEISMVQTTLARVRTAWAFLIRDVTTTTVMVKQLEEYAYRDPLTGLNNRRHFMELAQPAIGKAERMNESYYVLMLDLDHFKRVNDTHGHMAGDEVLRSCAAMIRKTLRGHDIVGRYGGEEFVVLITDAIQAEVVQLAERIRQNIATATIPYGDKDLRITISIGVAEREPEVDFEKIIDNADHALYIAKRKRNKVVFWRGRDAG